MSSICLPSSSTGLRSARSQAGSPLKERFEPLRRALVDDGRWCAGGLCLTAASGLACGQTLAPGLARLSAAAPALLEHFGKNLYFIGPVVSTLLGDTGVAGMVSCACLFGAATACVVAPLEGRQKTLTWALAHLAMGLSVSLYFVAGGTAFSPLGIGLLSAQALLSLVLTQKRRTGQATWMEAVLAVSLCFAIGPMGGQLLANVPQAVAAARAVGTLALAGILASAYTLTLNWQRFSDDSTAYAEQFLLPAQALAEHRLDLDLMGNAGPLPTVFDVQPDVSDLVLACRHMQRSGLPIGRHKLLMSGPVGTGKTVTAQAIAQAIGADFLDVKQTTLCEPRHGGQPMTNVKDLFDQARLLSKKHQRPIVLFFDEAELLFMDRRFLAPEAEAARIRTGMVQTFLTELCGVKRDPQDNMLVIAATNYPERLDVGMRSRFLLESRTTPAAAAELARILAKHLAEGAAARGLQMDISDPLLQAGLDDAADKLFAHQAVGRQAESVIEYATLFLKARQGENPRARVDDAALRHALNLGCARVSQQLALPTLDANA
jgi:MoxR-like ATPase